MSLCEWLERTPRPVLAAYVGPLFVLFTIGLAILLAPHWTWTDNALSDLGHYTRTDIGLNPLLRAIVFNTGLMVAGVLMFWFSVWLIRQMDDRPSQVSVLPLTVSVVFLVAIGVFSENFSPTHYIVSVGFFLSFPFSMWFMGLSWLRFRELRWFAALSLVLPFVSVYLWWGTYEKVMPWTNVAIPEILTAMTAIVWTWILATMLVQGRLTAVLKEGTPGSAA